MNNTCCSLCNCCPCKCCPKEEPENPCIICPEISKEYAYYSQSDRLYNSSLFGAIALENEPIQTSAFFYDTGIIQIFKPGNYLVTYIVNFPVNSIVNTTLALQLNNSNVQGTIIEVQKTEEGIPYSVTAQSIISINAISSIRLSSSKIISFTLSQNSTGASLSIIEI